MFCKWMGHQKLSLGFILSFYAFYFLMFHHLITIATTITKIENLNLIKYNQVLMVGKSKMANREINIAIQASLKNFFSSFCHK